jgi:hypothetical protein
MNGKAMTDWTPIENATPKAGDIALIIADQASDWGLVTLLPQLCVWEVDEDGSGFWVQMLRGNVYGLKVDGTPRLYMPISLPTSSSGATS